MANSNVTDLSHQSQLKDHISAGERLLICGIKHSSKHNKSAQKQQSGVDINFTTVSNFFRAMWSL